MIYINSRSTVVAISTGDHKRVAVYFDKLIPTHSRADVPNSLIEPIRFSDYKLSELFFSTSAEPLESDHLETIRDAAIRNVWREAPMSVRYSAEYLKHCFEPTVKASQDMWSNCKRVATIVQQYAQVDEGHFLVPAFDDITREHDFSKPGNDEIVSVTLSNLDLIDTNRLEWEQILELKKDDESNKKLRNLLLFFFQNYRDCPVSFIRDDLNRQIEEYHQACSKHGFQFVTSSLSTVLSSKSLLATIALGIFALLSGLPIQAIAPIGLTELALEIGKIAINYAERKRELIDYKEAHPLSYILQFPIRNTIRSAES